MKNITTLLMFLLAVSNVKAQRNCGDVENQNQIEAHYPQAIVNRQAIEQFTNNYINSPASQHSRAIVTIPVVIHILYNPSLVSTSFPYNPSDADVASQITRLNLDFSRTNTDWTNTPAVFQAAVGTPNIQFVLAKRDPSGLPTSGIVRKITSKTSFTNIGDSVKYSALGGDDAWPSTDYLNIWVCNLQNGNGIIGYAQFPGGPPASDGVVLRWDIFGDKGPAYSYMSYGKGRTATHEIGHWLNIYHIWGDDGTSCTGSDLVNDTENQAGYNVGTPTFPHVSCGTPNGDMFMNYMDYTNDAVTVMFTNGQVSRMQALFAPGGPRASLLTSMGGIAPSTSSSCGVPTGLIASAITQTSATISWTAVPNATSYTLQYKPTTSNTYTTINYFSNTTYNLTGLVAGTNYDWRVSATCPNGTGTYGTATLLTVAIPGCTDIYEPNNTYSLSKSVPAATVIHGTINTMADVDFFYCKSSISAPNVKITLNMTRSYNMLIYKDGVPINTGTQTAYYDQECVINTSTYNNYYVVKIYPYNLPNNFDNDHCYNLKYEFSATPFEAYVPDNKIDVSNTSNLQNLENFETNVYPNPNNGAFKVEIFNFTNNKNATIYIMDVLGKIIHTQEVSLNDGLTTADVNASLPTGIYQVVTKNGEYMSTKKIVVTE